MAIDPLKWLDNNGTEGDKSNGKELPNIDALNKIRGKDLNDLRDKTNEIITALYNREVAIGEDAGITSQGDFAVAIGPGAGKDNQEEFAVAIGPGAGKDNQGGKSIAIGSYAGQLGQGDNAVTIGPATGQTDQGDYAVAIGSYAGQLGQGDYAVAIGSYAGNVTQHNNSIVINASDKKDINAANEGDIVLNAKDTKFEVLNTGVAQVNGKPIGGTWQNVTGFHYDANWTMGHIITNIPRKAGGTEYMFTTGGATSGQVIADLYPTKDLHLQCGWRDASININEGISIVWRPNGDIAFNQSLGSEGGEGFEIFAKV